MARTRSESVASRTRSKLARIRLLALDVDGVLTDGSVTYAGATEVQRYHVHDGFGIVALLGLGIHVAWISGRGSLATKTRAKELGVRDVILRCKDKSAALAAIQRRLKISVEETAAMGDDRPDLELRARAGFFAAPADARDEIRELADLVTKARGGEGAVRELADLILRARSA